MKNCNCDYYNNGTREDSGNCPVHNYEEWLAGLPKKSKKKKQKKEGEMKQRVKIEPKGERMLRPVSEEGTPSTKVTIAPSSNDFFAAVESVSTNKEAVKKEKNNMDILTPPETIKKKVDELVQWKKREKEAKAEKESREVDILEFGQKKYEEDGFGNNFQKSFRIKGITEMITFVSSDKFSAIKAEDIPQLKEILGVKFEEMIQKKQSVSLKAEVLSNPELQKELMTYVPKEKFGAFFQADVYYLTVDGFDRKLFSLGRKVVEKIRELVRQAKPSLK